MRAQALVRLGRHKNAKADFAKAIEFKESLTLLQQASALAELGRWQEAADAFQQFAASSNAHIPWCSAAVIRHRLGDKEGYRKICHEMVQRLPKFADKTAANAIAWHCILGPDALADWQPLEKALADMVKQKPESWAIRGALGMLHYRQGHFQEAVKELNHAVFVQKQGGTWDMCVFLAMAHHQLKQPDDANRWWDKAVKMIDAALQEPREGQPVTQTSAWNFHLARQILRKEAGELIGPNSK